ncbi:ATP-grasp domain-containing protein [Amycolatopsis sp. H20-H5]|uniref:ATP-grasp domain-containing protein n=1 Tax=Amycolatopsis sp. H20-H5 TaxID=3046309 RepID=UPI002DB5F030|nr:ATP-grasp domain-containing protein [Amycolatopsis sp. H20-H5]MEC3982170.1 ATP-grasp domain-containing protein [Amycolatopsis sp. H20-H5]
MTTLVLPPRLTASAESVRAAAQARGLHTVRLPTFEVPGGLSAEHLHAGPSFADVVARVLGIALLEAPPEWLSLLPRTFTRREVRLMPVEAAYALRGPFFGKSPNDKSIRAMIYTDGSRLPGPDAVERDTPLLVSDVVRFDAEFRLHVLDGAVVSSSRYAEAGQRSLGPANDDAVAFGAELLSAAKSTVPSAIVIDVGLVDGNWAVIEANAAWASGCYTADPAVVLDVVLRSARPASTVTEADRPFVRAVAE